MIKRLDDALGRLMDALESTGQADDLFDLQTDPYELANLVDTSSHAEVRKQLGERLLARMAEIGEPSARIEPVQMQTGFSQRTVDYPNTRV